MDRVLKFGFWVLYPQWVFTATLFFMYFFFLLPFHDLNMYLHENFVLTWAQLSIVLFMVLEAIRNRKLILQKNE